MFVSVFAHLVAHHCLESDINCRMVNSCSQNFMVPFFNVGGFVLTFSKRPAWKTPLAPEFGPLLSTLFGSQETPSNRSLYADTPVMRSGKTWWLFHYGVWDEASEDRWREKWDFVSTNSSDLTFTVSLSRQHFLEPMWYFDIRVCFIMLSGLEYNTTSVSLTPFNF